MSLEIEYDSQPLQKQQDEATEKGLKLLHKTKNRCYGYYELPCGHFLSYIMGQFVNQTVLSAMFVKNNWLKKELVEQD